MLLLIIIKRNVISQKDNLYKVIFFIWTFYLGGDVIFYRKFTILVF